MKSPRAIATLLAIAAAALALMISSTAATADTLVVANKGEATVSMIDLDSGSVVATLPTGDGPHEVAVSPDGRRALVTNYGTRGKPGSTLTLIGIATPEVLATIDLGTYSRPHGALFLDASRAVVTAEDQRALLIVDLDSGTVEKAIDTDQAVSHMVALDATKRRAFVANIGSHSLTVIDLEAGKRLENIETGQGAEGVTVAGDQVWVTNRAADTITVLDATSLETRASFESAGFPIRAKATPDGAHVLVTRARAGDLMIYETSEPGRGREVALDIPLKDTEDRQFGDRFGDSSVPIGIAVTADGRRAFIAHANADVISEHALPSGEKLRILTAGREPDGMAYSPVSVTVGTSVKK